MIRTAHCQRYKLLCRVSHEVRPVLPRSAFSSRAMAMPKLSDGTSWNEYHSRWENIWSSNLQPGQAFDKACASKRLTSLIDDKSLSLRAKRAFVPGCGRGYDLVALALGGAEEAVGLELSHTAVERAREYLQSALPDASADNVAVLEGDFFAYQDPKGGFDLGYDYTFLCALHPDMRTDWAAAWARHLKPGGELLTMIYPIDPARDVSKGYQGPPWPVTPQLYQDLLLPAGFKCTYLEPVPQELSHSDRAGMEYLGRWIRQ